MPRKTPAERIQERREREALAAENAKRERERAAAFDREYPDGNEDGDPGCPAWAVSGKCWRRRVDPEPPHATVYRLGGGKESAEGWEWEAEVYERGSAFRWSITHAYGNGYEMDAGFCRTLGAARRVAASRLDEIAAGDEE